MKIKHVVHIIDQLSIGGAQKLLATFAHEADHREIRVDVICLKFIETNWIIRDLEANGVCVEFINANSLFNPRRFINLCKYILQLKPDIIQTHLTYANILGGLAGFLTGVPVISTLHLAGPDKQYSKLREIMETWVIRFFSRWVIAVGPETGQTHAHRLGSAKMRVVLNAVEAPALPTQVEKAQILQDLGINENNKLIISVGRFSIVKAFHILIQAFASYREINKEVILVLVGDGSMKPDCEKLADDLGVSEYVRFTGFRDDVSLLLAISDLYVCSSTVEGTPLAVMEAISAGLPVVSTDVGDLPVIIDESFGVLVKPNNPQEITQAIQSIISDSTRCMKMSEDAKNYASSNFSSSKWVDRLLTIYEEAILQGE